MCKTATNYIKKAILIFIFVGFFLSVGFGQTNDSPQINSNQVGLYNSYLLSSISDENQSGTEIKPSLAFKTKERKWGAVNLPLSLTVDDFEPWESQKHFWVGAGEIALLEFIPWALARWIRHWEDPKDNWAKVTPDTWWRNLSHGWEYDGRAGAIR